MTARFFVPDSFGFKSVSVPEGVTAVSRREAGGKVLKGLARRREAEHKLFCTPVEKRGYSGKFPELPKRGI